MTHSKKQYNLRLLQNLQSERSMAIASHNLERLEILNCAIKIHLEISEEDAEEERMEALRGECGLTSKAQSR